MAINISSLPNNSYLPEGEFAILKEKLVYDVILHLMRKKIFVF